MLPSATGQVHMRTDMSRRMVRARGIGARDHRSATSCQERELIVRNGGESLGEGSWCATN
eukprot:COSAG06_NODE_42799_length_378_cov_0.928315_1_plen_59_part_10